MKYLKKLLVNKDLNLSDLKDIKIDQLKIRPDEIMKLNDTSMINFIFFIKNFKNNNVELGNEKEILTSLTRLISKYKLTPKNKNLVSSLIKNDENLKEIFKDLI